MTKSSSTVTASESGRFRPWPCRAAAAVLMLLFWAWYNADMLYKIQDNTLFLCTSDFFREMLRQPAGLLNYASRFFTQFCIFPLAGAALLTAWWMLAESLQARALRLTGTLRPLSCLVPFLFTAAQTRAGYYIYIDFDNAFLFSLPIGLCCAYAFILSIRRMRSDAARTALALALTVAGYAVIGSYAFIGGLAATLYAWDENKRHRSMLIIAAVIVMLLGIILPLIAFQTLWYAPLHTCQYAPLPSTRFPEVAGATAIAGGCVILLACIAPMLQRISGKAALCVLAAGLAGCFAGSFKNANFRAELRMQRMLEAGDFEGIIHRAAKLKSPTTAVSAYRAIALDFTGRIGDELFQFPYMYTAMPMRTEVPAHVIHEREFALYASCINNCYMVTMTQVVNYGLRPSDLKFYVQCALLNGENSLAIKNLYKLQHTLFHRRWAAGAVRLLTDPSAWEENAVAARIRENMSDEPILTSGSAGVIQYYMRITQGDLIHFERFLMDCLYTKELDLFWSRAGLIPSIYGEQIPVHVQEAIALIGLMDGEDISGFGILPAILQRTTQFIEQVNSFGNNFEAAKTALEASYGNLYSYFYYFRSLLSPSEENARSMAGGSVN